MRRSRVVFHPLFVLASAALAIFGYTGLMRWRFAGGDLSNHFMYVVPIIVPCVAFIFDRARYVSGVTLIELTIDSAVVVTSFMRMMGVVPLVSGHALFLTYAIARPGSRLTKITAALVMLQVIYLKFLVWHDWVSPITGITLGLLAAFVVRRLAPKTVARLTPLTNTQ
jgi:hypothetical protein